MADFGPRTRRIRVESIQPAGLQTIEGVLPWGQIDPNDAWALAQPLLKAEPPQTGLAFAQSILGWSDRWENAIEVADRAIRMATVRDPSLRARVNEFEIEANRTRLRLPHWGQRGSDGRSTHVARITRVATNPWQPGFGIGPDQDAAFERLRLTLGELEGLTLESAPSDLLLRALIWNWLHLECNGRSAPPALWWHALRTMRRTEARGPAAWSCSRTRRVVDAFRASRVHSDSTADEPSHPADEQAILVRLLVAARQHQDTSPRQAVRWWYAGMREVVTSALTGRSRIDDVSRRQAVEKLRDRQSTTLLSAPWSTTPGPETWEEDAVFGLLVEMLVALKRDLPELHALSKSADTKAMLAFLGGDEAGFFRGGSLLASAQIKGERDPQVDAVSSTTTPSTILTTRSARAAMVGSWVTMTMLRPSR